MPQLIIILLVVFAIYWGIKWFARAKPGEVRQAARVAGGVAAMVIGAGLTLRGAADIGLPLALFGLGMSQSTALWRLVGKPLTGLSRPLEIYLDRRFPGWRRHVDENTRAGMGRAPDARAMSEKEAYEILGLQPGAGADEIRAAHRRLIVAVHPDKGGSNFLASRINEARDRLLANHG